MVNNESFEVWKTSKDLRPQKLMGYKKKVTKASNFRFGILGCGVAAKSR